MATTKRSGEQSLADKIKSSPLARRVTTEGATKATFLGSAAVRALRRQRG